jgi:hypothetical protein
MNKGMLAFILRFLNIYSFDFLLLFNYKLALVGTLVRNRYRRLIIIVLAVVLIWGCFLLFDASSSSSQLRHHHLNQKNIEKVNFMVDEVFRKEGANNENTNENDQLGAKSSENIPVILDESNKAKLEKKLIAAINVINKDNVDNNQKISIINEKQSNKNDEKKNNKIELVNLNNDQKKNFVYDNNIQLNNNNRNPTHNQISESLLNKLERVVHIDLKGAPPKPDYFKAFIPFLKEHGATGK